MVSRPTRTWQSCLQSSDRHSPDWNFQLLALQQTFIEIITRHESLRTNFPTRDGDPIQLISAEFDFRLPVTDLSCLTEGERLAEASPDRRGGAAVICTAGRLTAACSSITLEFRRTHLALHHASHRQRRLVAGGAEPRSDGAVRAFVQGRPLTGGAAIQYADYAAWQREWLRGSAGRADCSIGETQLEGAPPLLELPTDQPRAGTPG